MVDEQTDQRRFRPIVRLVVSPITFSDVRSEAIANWGAALVSWIDELERLCQRVEVIWLSCSRPGWIIEGEKSENRGGPPVAFSFVLKAADQPVEIDRLAFWIMHPAAQRRIQFALKEQLDVEKWYKENYGVPISDAAFLKQIYGKEALIFSIENGAASVEEGISLMKERASTYLRQLDSD